MRGRFDEDGGSPRPWLLGIAGNVTRNARRAARRHTDAVARLPRDEVAADFADGRLDEAAEPGLLGAARPRCAGRSVRCRPCAATDYGALAKLPTGLGRMRAWL
ncbi:hypothetical protein [Streptomyces sp. NPDC001296]